MGNRASRPNGLVMLGFLFLGEPMATHEERRARASLAAHVSWANTTDPAQRTRAARAALDDKFRLQVDPQGTLEPDELERRVTHLRQAHFRRLALKSAQARRARLALHESEKAQAELDELGGDA